MTEELTAMVAAIDAEDAYQSAQQEAPRKPPNAAGWQGPRRRGRPPKVNPAARAAAEPSKPVPRPDWMSDPTLLPKRPPGR